MTLTHHSEFMVITLTLIHVQSLSPILTSPSVLPFYVWTNIWQSCTTAFAVIISQLYSNQLLTSHFLSHQIGVSTEPISILFPFVSTLSKSSSEFSSTSDMLTYCSVSVLGVALVSIPRTTQSFTYMCISWWTINCTQALSPKREFWSSYHYILFSSFHPF